MKLFIVVGISLVYSIEKALRLKYEGVFHHHYHTRIDKVEGHTFIRAVDLIVSLNQGEQ